MITLSSTGLAVIQYAQDHAILQRDFAVTADATLELGTAVKMNTAGTVEAITAATDVLFGTVNRKKDHNGKVGVATRFKMIVRGKADGAVNAGAIVDAVAFDATDGLHDYKATVTNGNKIGQCITGGADNATIEVGLFF